MPVITVQSRLSLMAVLRRTAESVARSFPSSDRSRGRPAPIASRHDLCLQALEAIQAGAACSAHAQDWLPALEAVARSERAARGE